MPAPEPIASKTSLQERLARLKLPDGQQPPTSSPSSSSSAKDVRTGAVGRISDKIGRFQAKAEDAPLLPEGGSFGFAPARPRASGGGSAERETGVRVASLGGGRAPVPLNVVKPRSASAGNASPTTRSEGSGSAPGSRAASRQGSEAAAGGDEPRAATPVMAAAEETPVPSPTASTSSMVEKPLVGEGNDLSSLPLPVGARTPGALSVSSMNVETGSLTSEGAAHNPNELDTSVAHLAGEEHSPLSSPVLSGLAIAASSTSSVSSIDAVAPYRPPTGTSKGPLTSLKAPSRTGSVTSLSSMAVEAPSDDVADLTDVASVVETPLAEERGRELSEAEPQETEEERAARLKAELEKYEKDEADPVAHAEGEEETVHLDGEAKEPPPVEVVEEEARAQTPVATNGEMPDLSEKVEEEKPSEEEAPKEEEAEAMPKVKCSDCGGEIDLMELADHSCESTNLPPALSSPPTSPQPPPHSTLSPPIEGSFLNLAPDSPAVPKDVEPALPPTASSPTSPRNLASSIRSSLSRTSSQQSSTSRRPPSETLDRFVPQTDSLVPEDVPADVPEEEDDLLDPAEHSRPARSIPPPKEQSVPEDIPEDEGDFPGAGSSSSPSLAPPVPLPTLGAASASSSAMARSASTPAQTPGAASHLRAQRKASGPRAKSLYGIPGQYISSDDEDGYEGGSATIVRSSRGGSR
ncbi:hypothetical protein JCM8097_006061 [Rhodosporidiobolus ruineniae]